MSSPQNKNRSPGGKSASNGPAGKKSASGRATRTAVLRRPPAKGLPRLLHQLRSGWRRLLEISPFWVVMFLLVSTWCLLPRRAFFVPRAEAGSIADRTYVADRDLSIPDQDATLLLQQGARENVLPIYDFNRSRALERRSDLAALFQAGRALLAETADKAERKPTGRAAPAKGETADREADLLTRLGQSSAFKIDDAAAEVLLGRQFSNEDEDRLVGILSRVLQTGVVSNKELLLEHRVGGITIQELPSGARSTQLDLYRYLDYPVQVREEVESELASWDGLSKAERRVFSELILANVTPNLTFNSSATLALENDAAVTVGTVTHSIRKGEVIVRRGGLVDKLAARAIDAMAATGDFRGLLLTAVGTFALLAAAMLLVWLACGHEARHDRSRERFLSECSMLLMLSLLGARLAHFVAEAISNAFPNPPFNSLDSYVYATPFAAVALVTTLLYGRNVALVLSLLFSLLVGHIAAGDAIWTTIFYALAGSLAAAFAVDNQQFKQRSAMTRAGAVIGLVNGLMLLILKALSGTIEGGLPQVGFDFVCGFAGGLLAAAVASFSIPILENLLQITTAIKLVELANPNLPLLRRLAVEAPGTFQHSLAVANLAKSGVEAIDGDSVLVNTSALYHDIGKMYRPRYFIENQAQMPGKNPHDKIQPSMSALILINHVKEGVELAHHHHLPQPIFDAIEQHHGTRLINFFYSRAKERCDPETEEVREDDFRYPGPKPSSKEMGVLMLADGVEAASRTLVDPSRQKIRLLLRTLFEDCLKDGQLDETGLTLGELRHVEEAFLRVLTNIYHQRIDYPGFEFNRGEDSKVIQRPSTGPRESQERKAS